MGGSIMWFVYHIDTDQLEARQTKATYSTAYVLYPAHTTKKTD